MTSMRLVAALNMSHLLLRSSALKAPIMSCAARRSIACMAGYPTLQLPAYSGGGPAFNTRYIQPAFSGSRTRCFATIQSVEASYIDEPQADDESKPKSRKQRRKNTKQINLTRVDKVLAHRGVGSRSQVFELAKAKRITTADRPDAPHEERTRIKGPKEKVPFDAPLFLDGKLLPGPPPLLLVYHKPKYVLSVMEDDPKYQDQNRKHLGQVLEPRYVKAGMHPVGRLDYDTTGLILFSRDGTLTQRLLHPRRGVKKEYVATVQGLVDEKELGQKLKDGVETTEGTHTAKLLAVSSSDGPSGDGDSDGMLEIDDEESEAELDDDFSGPYSDVRLVVKEGKHRMVRRMLANCGHPVVELRRERHGKIDLGDLPLGEFREATEEELEWAESLIDR